MKHKVLKHELYSFLYKCMEPCIFPPSLSVCKYIRIWLGMEYGLVVFTIKRCDEQSRFNYFCLISTSTSDSVPDFLIQLNRQKTRNRFTDYPVPSVRPPAKRDRLLPVCTQYLSRILTQSLHIVYINIGCDLNIGKTQTVSLKISEYSLDFYCINIKNEANIIKICLG